MNSNAIPKIAIVGRTNVGKSTLFNRFIEEQKSLVSSIPGTTRDRFEGDCVWRGKVIRFIDTGGIDIELQTDIDKGIVSQANSAIEDADIILFVVDLKAGLQSQDRMLAKQFMESGKKILVAGNKADKNNTMLNVNDISWHKWPLTTPIAISAVRGLGTGDLLDIIFDELETLGKPAVDIQEVSGTRIAVVGRPNVGKSSILNAILGSERFIAADIEHTTREPNDAIITHNGKDYTFIDTAGIRRLARVKASSSKLEKSGVRSSIEALRRSDVILLVLDITKPIHSQDKRLSGMAEDSNASVIIIANKWDLIPDKDPSTINKYEKYLRAHLPMLSYAPIVFTSALTNKRIPELFDVIDKVFQNRFIQFDDEEMKGFISKAIIKHKPSRGKGTAHPQIMSFKQIEICPPKFALAIRHVRKDVLADSYLRFLKNLLRAEYDFSGVSIRIIVKTKKKSHTTD